MFDINKGYYMVYTGHANSAPMVNLIDCGGLTYYGFYRWLFEVSLLSDGEISKKNLQRFGMAKGKMTEDDVNKFIEVCQEQDLIQSKDGQNTMYVFPEVKDYLLFASESKKQRTERARKGGYQRAENAKTQNEDVKKTGRTMMATDDVYRAEAEKWNHLSYTKKEEEEANNV